MDILSLKTPLIGVHLSIKKGFADIFKQAETLGCTAVQIFTKSNRQWWAKTITDEEISTFKKAHALSHHIPVVAHATYLINICSPEHDTEKKSCMALIDELIRCEQLGIPYLVLHPGSRLGSPLEESLSRIAHNIQHALNQVPGTVHILLETMAGQGSSVGSTFEEMGIILSQINNPRVGVCLDTCHVFAAGYDFTTAEGYQNLWHSFNTYIGKKYLKLIHVNDSIKPCGSKVDRHCDIGKGKIGIAGFRSIMQDKTLDHIPKILETPKKSPEDDSKNLAIIKALAQKN